MRQLGTRPRRLCQLSAAARAQVRQEAGEAEPPVAAPRPGAVTQRHHRNSFSSAHKGVSWDKKSKRWQAELKSCGKMEQLGLFATEAEAKARRDARCLELQMEQMEQMEQNQKMAKAAMACKLSGCAARSKCLGLCTVHYHLFSRARRQDQPAFALGQVGAATPLPPPERLTTALLRGGLDRRAG